jgi:hypothetical protein
MEVETAVQLINEQLVYKPGWRFEADDHRDRFEGAVRLRVHYPAAASGREDAYRGYPREIDTHADFALMVDQCDVASLCRQLITGPISVIDQHEAREFLRLCPTMWSPFHPHRADGMRRWGDPDGDLKFGLC